MNSIVETSHRVHVEQDNLNFISYNQMTGILSGRFFDDSTIERLKAIKEFTIDIKVLIHTTQHSQSIKRKLRQKTLDEVWNL